METRKVSVGREGEGMTEVLLLAIVMIYITIQTTLNILAIKRINKVYTLRSEKENRIDG